MAYTEVAGIYKAAGTDCIIFDLEHGSYDAENIGELLYTSILTGIMIILVHKKALAELTGEKHL